MLKKPFSSYFIKFLKKLKLEDSLKIIALFDTIAKINEIIKEVIKNSRLVIK